VSTLAQSTIRVFSFLVSLLTKEEKKKKKEEKKKGKSKKEKEKSH